MKYFIIVSIGFAIAIVIIALAIKLVINLFKRD
jgi:hypothetical protein